MEKPINQALPDAMIFALRQAKNVTVLTGAGISAESGIPTFRDSQTGLWKKYNPQELATPEAFHDNPSLVMAWYRWRHELVEKAEPNAGHAALAEIERRLPNFTLVTQNVDGLHVRAGSRNIIELHGSLRRLRCSASCGHVTEGWPESELPRCPRCDALLRPDVVWFGEMLQESALEAALSASRNCELFFSIGTSGIVEPAASLPYQALRAGAVMVEINPNPTPLSVYSHYLFQQTAGMVLPRIIASAWGAPT